MYQTYPRTRLASGKVNRRWWDSRRSHGYVRARVLVNGGGDKLWVCLIVCALDLATENQRFGVGSERAQDQVGPRAEGTSYAMDDHGVGSNPCLTMLDHHHLHHHHQHHYHHQAEKRRRLMTDKVDGAEDRDMVLEKTQPAATAATAALVLPPTVVVATTASTATTTAPSTCCTFCAILITVEWHRAPRGKLLCHSCARAWALGKIQVDGRPFLASCYAASPSKGKLSASAVVAPASSLSSPLPLPPNTGSPGIITAA